MGDLRLVGEILRSENVDPDMVDQFVVDGWWIHRNRTIPTVFTAVDGNRLELNTYDASAKSVTARILAEYERISGIPVLCNTNANLNSHGFFPDVATAATWARTRYIWAEGRLYTNPGKL